MSSGWKTVLACAAVWTALFVALATTSQSLGFTRDEGYYFKAATLYEGWFHDDNMLSQTAIDAHLSYNPEHPFLMKGLFAVSKSLNGAMGSPVLSSTAMRAPAWAVAALSVLLVFFLARCFTSARASVLAALLWVSMPHVFWHMHVACFDIAVATAHVAAVLAYWHWRLRPRRLLALGAVVGLCFATKHNIFPIVVVFLLHNWFFDRGERPAVAGVFRVPLFFVSIATVGFAVYVAFWPYLWPAPVARIAQYLAFHLRHENYPILYFGELLTQPPFPVLFPFVMTAVTVQVPLVVAFVLGVAFAAFRARQKNQRSAMWLLLVNALFPFVLIALPSTPIFGGTKHWMNGLPFLCILAALIVDRATKRMKKRIFVMLATGLIIPGGWMSVRQWPLGLGTYNEWIGFSRGAANVGMQRTFWGYELRSLLPQLQGTRRLHPGDVNPDSIAQYKTDGLLPKSLQYARTVVDADVAFVEPQGEFQQQQLDVWNAWGRAATMRVLEVDGVPIGTLNAPVRSR
jgi:predicted membrane-bound dolichyl-phosphate-mannose-protein mannosyltransferase